MQELVLSNLLLQLLFLYCIVLGTIYQRKLKKKRKNQGRTQIDAHPRAERFHFDVFLVEFVWFFARPTLSCRKMVRISDTINFWLNLFQQQRRLLSYQYKFSSVQTDGIAGRGPQ